MTISIREQILQSLATTLASLPGVGGRVYRSRVAAFSRDEAPALVIEAGQCTPTPANQCRLSWALDLIVSSYARGTIPDTKADATLTAAHALIMADRTVGGLAFDLLPAQQTTDLERADADACWLTAVYRIQFQTRIDDLTAQ